MRIVTILIALVCAAGCSASAGPVTDAEVRAAVIAALADLDAGIEREDQFLASSPAGDKFSMADNIAVRYTDDVFSGSGQPALRGLFTNSFDLHANILHETTLTEFNINGEVVTVTATVEFSSLRVDKVPPENFIATATDIFVFTMEKGSWKLLVWGEPPPEEPPAEEPPADPPAE